MLYDILYIDFPFRFNERNNPNTKFGRGVHGHYDTMSLTDLMLLKPEIDAITHKNSMIMSWASGSLDNQNSIILNYWGYTKITKLFTWVKVSKDGKPLALPGNFTASNTEDVWLFRKLSGKPLPRLKKMVNQVIIDTRREHSRKPDIVRQHITDIFGDTNRLEMFGRLYDNKSKFGSTKYIDGWKFIGKDIDKIEIRESLINCKEL